MSGGGPAQGPVRGVAPVDVVEATVGHSGIRWVAGGVVRDAVRGQRVVLPRAEFERLAAQGAFSDEAGALPAVVGAFPVDGSAGEQVAWVAAHSAEEVLAAAQGFGSVMALMEAEEARGVSGTRMELVLALQAVAGRVVGVQG